MNSPRPHAQRRASPTALDNTNPVRLDDKWTVRHGRVLLNGTQALARVLLTQRSLDEKAGLNTAGYISGYRGSPLGGVDMTLWSIAKRLAAASVTFAPGVNEDLAATAVRGTQQLDAVPDPLVDGVFAAWYGKGPGVDRSIDALKHGNYMGAHRNGGVLLFYGDDHGGKSSTVAHHSEQAMASALIPSLYPANVGEILEFGILGYAMSRYSGSWVGLKLVNEVAEQTASVDIDTDRFAALLPDFDELPPEGVHARSGPFNPQREEQVVSECRLPMVEAFVRANSIDRTIFRAEKPRLGLVAAGKSYTDTRQALELLGLDASRAAALGISLYKVGCIWPLEPQGIAAFAAGHELLFFIEEKKSFVELQAASLIVNMAERPRVVGKRDEDGEALLPLAAQLEPVRVALAIAERMKRLGIADARLTEAATTLRQATDRQAPGSASTRRSPFFCSGCPHSRSTKVPEGSLSMTGIGCHTMAAFARPDQALLPTHMGGEGGNWLGLSQYTGTAHMFQNMGDGTYYHSGLLAIRAAVASGANITYKILYNDAVAMTGGQPVDGPISVAEIAQQVRHEGVETIWLLSDNPAAHQGNAALPPGVRIEHRDVLDTVQKMLREVRGCSVLIYEQTCAAEKRRRRKRGTFPDPAKRLFIAEAVCEGCGDCSVQSTCVSLMPTQTGFGTKRKIDQSSCNKDESCLNGFCPSFLTVRDAEPRKPDSKRLSPSLFDDLPPPRSAPLGEAGFNMMVAGIGGTGVITVAAILGMAAHIEGKAVSLFDMTGLAQKNGAVFSHVRIAASPDRLHAQKLGMGEADLLIAFDPVAALEDEASATIAAGRTQLMVNSNVLPTAAFQFDRDAKIDAALLLTQLQRRAGEKAVTTADASKIAAELLGDTIGANMFLVGAAVQRGLLPVGIAAIERAIALNGTAAAFNLSALRLGRLFIESPDRVAALLPPPKTSLPQSLDDIIALQVAHLTAYQDEDYAKDYRSRIAKVREAEQRALPGSERITAIVARQLGRLRSYKDEYEVARLLSSPALREELRAAFAGTPKLSLNLSPPIFAGRDVNGRPRKREYSARWMVPALRLLAKAKGLRGTAFDPFGRTRERRAERALIAAYEALVEDVIGKLRASNINAAAELLDLVAMVRGFGPVKDASLAAYEAAIVNKRKAFFEAGGRAATSPRPSVTPDVSLAE